MKVIRELTEKMNNGNAHRKYSIREFKGHLPNVFTVDVDALIV